MPFRVADLTQFHGGGTICRCARLKVSASTISSVERGASSVEPSALHLKYEASPMFFEGYKQPLNGQLCSIYFLRGGCVRADGGRWRSAKNGMDAWASA